MELQEVIKDYLTKLHTVTDLVDIKPALQDEDDTLIAEYGNLAKSSIFLATVVREFKEETDKSQELTTELQVIRVFQGKKGITPNAHESLSRCGIFLRSLICVYK